jgi:hypothetical protein
MSQLTALPFRRTYEALLVSGTARIRRCSYQALLAQLVCPIGRKTAQNILLPLAPVAVDTPPAVRQRLRTHASLREIRLHSKRVITYQLRG